MQLYTVSCRKATYTQLKQSISIHKAREFLLFMAVLTACPTLTKRSAATSHRVCLAESKLSASNLMKISVVRFPLVK